MEQWHLPEEPLHLPERLFSDELHFRFNEEEERGGFPPEEARERLVIWKAEEDDACLLSVSPVNDDILKEFARETSGEYEKLIVFPPQPPAAAEALSFLGPGERFWPQ